MTSRSGILLLCLTFFLLSPVCAEETTVPRQGIVTWIYDGDTLEIDPGGRVRLIGIDAPEHDDSSRDRFLQGKGISAAKLRQISAQARQFNIDQVKGKMVTLTFDESPRDRHGRLLAYVQLPDGRLLNRVLLERGLVVVYRRFAFKMKVDFLAAEDEARQAAAGLWAKESDRP